MIGLEADEPTGPRHKTAKTTPCKVEMVPGSQPSLDPYAAGYRYLVTAREIRSGHRFQNPCDGMRNAWLKREDAFCHAMIIVSSAMVSSS